jgi:hypothetical protein
MFVLLCKVLSSTIDGILGKECSRGSEEIQAVEERTKVSVESASDAVVLSKETVEFITMEELAKLRSGADKQVSSKKRKKASPKDYSIEEDVDVKELREIALDYQYNEDKDNMWQNIPAEEVLPIDRAAPCLAHLLTR